MERALNALARRIEIRWADLDSSRHVNNAIYLTYLEQVRSAWVEEMLGSRARVDDFVLARVEIDFRRELTLDDEYAVARCGLARLGTSSIRTSEEISTEGGELVARAECVIVARDETGRARPLTDAERAAFTRPGT
ncbi:MAG: acyl-CoA thioesterase [Gaiellaceae bacterium]